jgi:hypothetical protein
VRSGVSVNVSSSKADLGMAKKGTFLLPNRVVLPWEVEGGVAMQFGSRPLNPAWIDPIAHIAPFRQRIDEARADRARERSILASQMAVKESSASVLREKIAAFDAEDEELRRGEDRALALEEARLLAVRNARYKNWPREKLLLSATVLVSGATSDSVSVQGFVDQRLEPYGRSVTVTPHLGVETEPLPQRLQWRGGIYLEPARFEDANPRVHGTAGLDIRLWTVNAFGLFPHPWTLRLALDLASRYTNWGVSLGPWH